MSKPTTNKVTKCTNCGKEFSYSDYAKLCDAILEHKAACSYECNKKLGQVK